jgi:hypothetical protein
MKNGIHSSENRLVLINSAGQPVEGQDALDGTVVDYRYHSEADTGKPSLDKTNTALLTLMAVSIACTTAAIATGSYAIWLSRQTTAQKTLTDVNEILKSCQSRMQQLEADVQHLPGREA